MIKGVDLYSLCSHQGKRKKGGKPRESLVPDSSRSGRRFVGTKAPEGKGWSAKEERPLPIELLKKKEKKPAREKGGGGGFIYTATLFCSAGRGKGKKNPRSKVRPGEAKNKGGRDLDHARKRKGCRKKGGKNRSVPRL